MGLFRRKLIKSVCIIQSRLGSSRLPGKALMEMAGKPMIQHVVERVFPLKVDQVVVAVPEQDLVKYRFLGDLKCLVVGGSDRDVLGRYYKALQVCPANVIVRVTGDCPLYDPVIGNFVLSHWFENRANFITNDTRRSGYPDGTDTEVFNFLMLANAARLGSTPAHREHVTPWMADNAPTTLVQPLNPYPVIKLSVDTQEDFDRVKAILEAVPSTYVSDHGEYELATTLAAAKAAGVL